ncbi:hypothetical protein [Nostoc commune]|uniref:hypothetical protein n=1 Tax=Nostoc commune TaxID=1178 RepID=UPI002ED7A3C6
MSNNSAFSVEDTTRRHLSRPNQGLRQLRSGGIIQPCAADVVRFWFSPLCQGAS